MEEMRRTAAIISRRYARKCWWVERDELVQVAMLAQVESTRTYDPTFGPPIGAYAYRSALYAVQRAVLRASAPVSPSSHRPNVLGLSRASLTVPMGENAEESQERDEVCAANAHGVEYLSTLYTAVRVQERLTHLLGEDGAVFALLAITHQFTPAEIAEHNDIDREHVYRRIQQIKKVLAGDPVLHALWSD